MIEVEIDKGSGFCFGVVTAIESAERELKNTNTLYCLGDIVHNSLEVERLEESGLRTIEHDEFTRLKGEKVLQVLLVIEDITAIEKTESLRREFVSNASHELKTPITIISGFIETIKLGHIKDEKQLNHFVEIMEKEVKRLALLTDNLLHLSRAEKILAENSEEKILNLKLLLEEIRKSFFNIAERKKIEIEIKADDKEIKTKLSNEWFRTVIGNLIDNSIKYSNNDSKIELIGYIKGEYLSITIKDEGIGIPKEELENIFRRFYRVDKSRNRKIEGNGLGLAIVKNMVYSINGKINIESEVGLGTKIVLEFPLL